MKIGVYQFASTGHIQYNLSKITNAISKASNENIKLLVFHECALCGYPPIETKIENICPYEIDKALNTISVLAKLNKIFIAIGTVRFENLTKYNSMIVIDDHGIMMGHYDKRAIWGWDESHFSRGNGVGIFKINNLVIGFRICFDIRFPELFRELYKQNTDICFVSFSDTSETPLPIRYETIKAHLITRAVENVMTVISVNSITGYQTAPSAIIDINGKVLKEAITNKEQLLSFEYVKPVMNFGEKGRLVNNDYFMNMSIPFDEK